MNSSTNSAAYFSKTTEVVDFLDEFIRFRKKVLSSSDTNVSDFPLPNRPYRRSKFLNSPKGSKPSDDPELNGVHTDDHKDHDTFNELKPAPEDLNDSNQDNLLNVALQMSSDDELHLDAFISLVDAYYSMVLEFPSLDHSEFELSEVLKNAKITNRKFPKIENRIDIEWSKKTAHELKYQRLIKDIKELLVPSQTRFSEYKPPIISGLNIFFGVALTFIGSYSISGFLGLKDPLYKSLIGVVASFIALVVDTVLYLMKPTS
ncbi:Endoplasmic reticulum-based factor for assembly of V-ATPase family protein [Theileria parva strain Muguga]|uniref:Endoplasmic reticulum-based factor for assembly of V-ATPase family protein n=1 Tax=Theileria parva strain Muguga TaxID=333668 RepID=UPI001C61B731|nr:Endoplasmic reticulum-based factor for assembly of V-ATPase family protein [Theileria parva strain Muguga]EAN32370.2 Endoplasmic reticulum-based factor for assembly of V-ATPase family protein [Theileria parva strain Muguga]